MILQASMCSSLKREELCPLMTPAPYYPPLHLRDSASADAKERKKTQSQTHQVFILAAPIGELFQGGEDANGKFPWQLHDPRSKFPRSMNGSDCPGPEECDDAVVAVVGPQAPVK